MTDLSVGLDASVTTGPIEGSRKVYRELAEVPGARVPFRRVELSNGEHLDLYDKSVGCRRHLHATGRICYRRIGDLEARGRIFPWERQGTVRINQRGNLIGRYGRRAGHDQGHVAGRIKGARNR